jgi:RNA polymerase sigma-70 factor (ECF subfamily)
MSVATGVVQDRRIVDDLEQHRVALTRRCTRMLGSRSEAEDAVQETLLRAWRNHARFEGRCRLDSWLYRIATNVCVSMLNSRSRRAEPVDPELLQGTSLEAGIETDPVEQTLTREAFRAALLVAIDRLPARQRAVLMLRDALDWKASEVGELLGISTPAVSSLLQRARASLESSRRSAGGTMLITAEDSRHHLLASYLAAFNSYEIDVWRQSARVSS